MEAEPTDTEILYRSRIYKFDKDVIYQVYVFAFEIKVNIITSIKLKYIFLWSFIYFAIVFRPFNACLNAVFAISLR